MTRRLVSALVTFLATLGGLMVATTAGPSPVPKPSPLVAPLVADGPSPDLGEAAKDLDWLVGAWAAEVVDHPPDGAPRHSRGEWHFGWVLDGRALQDVWIVPPRGERGDAAPGPGNRYGTTLRVLDAATGRWRVTWVNPVSGVENRLTGGRSGDELVFIGDDEQGRRIRWSFTGIRADRFAWRGEASTDGGISWRTEAEFRLRRMPESPPAAERAYRWRWVDRRGLESLTVTTGGRGIEADGSVLAVLDGEPVESTYRLAYDADWHFRSGRIEVRRTDGQRTLTLERTPSSEWSIDRTPRPDLSGCADVDLMVTPFTNTPPLRRFALAEGETRALRVAWVRWPDLGVAAIDQEYARLAAPSGPDRYRYRNVSSGFTGELTVDGDGVVIDYGPWARLRP